MKLCVILDGNYVLRLVRIGKVGAMHRDVIRYSFSELVKGTIGTGMYIRSINIAVNS